MGVFSVQALHDDFFTRGDKKLRKSYRDTAPSPGSIDDEEVVVYHNIDKLV